MIRPGARATHKTNTEIASRVGARQALFMNKSLVLKFAQFALILIVGVLADQWTKLYAEDRLASPNLPHEIVLEVPASAKDKTLQEFLTQEFTWSSPEQIETIARRWVRDDNARRMSPDDKLDAAQKIHVRKREVVVVEGYWDHQYTRNPGAAFGLMADSDSQYRRPFFIGISIVALAIILYILSGVTLGQQLLIWGLSLIAAGAIGNFIDRVQYGYVIDFIVWKYTDEHRWPTFNIADVLICVGVGFMLIEIVRDTIRERNEALAAKDAEPDASDAEGA